MPVLPNLPKNPSDFGLPDPPFHLRVERKHRKKVSVSVLRIYVANEDPVDNTHAQIASARETLKCYQPAHRYVSRVSGRAAQGGMGGPWPPHNFPRSTCKHLPKMQT